MSDVYDVTDGLRNGISGGTDVEDDSLAEPFDPVPLTFGAWPLDEEHSSKESGPGVKVDFRVALFYCVDAKEQRARERHRATSLLLKARLLAITEYVRTHQSNGEVWQSVHVAAVDHEFLRNFKVRGFLVTVSGWYFQA